MADDGHAISSTKSRNARILAVLCELWCWLGPLLILGVITRATAARRDPFLRAVTAEVLNLRLVTFALLVLVTVAVAADWNLAAFFLWLAWLPVVAYSYVVGAIGAVKAWRGEAWKYPLNLDVVSG